MGQFRCPVCGCQKFYVKDPVDEYETCEFVLMQGQVRFENGVGIPQCPEIREDTEVFCHSCAWHGGFHTLP